MEPLTDQPVFLESAATTHANGSEESPQVPHTEAIRDWIDHDGKPTPLPDAIANHPLLIEANWVALRDRGRNPLDQSELVTTYQSRAEFLVGVWMLNLTVKPQYGGLLGSLDKAPQMLREVDVIGAGKRRNAVLMPRRSSKTTTLWCILVGRCYMRPMHMAGYTMLTLAKKAEERFELDVRNPIQRQWRVKVRGLNGPVKINDGKGGKGLSFPNGSELAVLAPKGDDIRSGAYDTMVMDEGGEPEPEDWDDIVGAVVPSFDTREGSQLIYAGTGGKYRTGSHFWKTLHDPKAGRIRYGVPDDQSPTELDSWEAGAGALIEKLHPGLDGLTTLDIIRDNFPDLGAERFALEYLGHFGDEHGNSTLLSVAAWKRGLQSGEPPEGITNASLAVAVHPYGHWASIAVAWHVTGPADLVDAAMELDGATITEPRVGLKLVHHQRGVDGIERELLRLSRRLNTPIVFDFGTSQTRAAVERLTARAVPKPEVTPYQLGDAKVAAAQLVRDLESGAVWHWAQGPADKAATIAIRQSMGQGFLIRGPKGDETADVTPLEAFALALAALPDRPVQALNPADVFEWD